MFSISSRSAASWLALVCTLSSLTARAASESALKPLQVGEAQWAVKGDVTNIAETVGFAPKGAEVVTVELKQPAVSNYTITGEILLSQPKSSVALTIEKPPAGAGETAAVTATARVGKNNALQVDRQRAAVPKLTETWLPFSVNLLDGRATIQVKTGPFKPIRASAPGDARRFVITLKEGQVRNLAVMGVPDLPKTLLPLALDFKANVRIAGSGADAALGAALDPASLPKDFMEADDIPFRFLGGSGANAVDVSKMPDQAIRGKKAKQLGLPDVAQPCEVPTEGYSALHVIAFSSVRPGTAPRLAVALGKTDTHIWVQQVVEVPPLSGGDSPDVVSRIPVKLADGKSGYLYHIRVPLAASADLFGIAPLGVQFTRDTSMPMEGAAVKAMDPPSSAVVLAATIEKSPVQMQYSSGEPANVFHDTQKVVFEMQLTSRSERPISGRVYAQCAGPGTADGALPGRREWTVEQTFDLKPGQTQPVKLDVTPARRGWYSCKLGVESGGVPLLVRSTSFAVLAPDTRTAMEDSPFGVWCFWNSHAVTHDPARGEKLASLMYKGGWRWTYGGAPGGRKTDGDSADVYARLRRDYKITFNLRYPKGAKGLHIKQGVTSFNEQRFQSDVVPWLAAARKSGVDPSYIVLHEDRTSKAVVIRYSELLGGQPYEMPPEESQLLEKQFKYVKQFCAAMKKADPTAKICLINDYPGFAAQYMKRKFPAELFDMFGSEGAMFARQAERQPDWLCLLGQIAQWKRLQAEYGYNKPVWFTEALYHGTGPGRLTLHEQAVTTVREAMLALAGGIQRMAMCGVIVDSSDNYTRTDWGVAGYCFRDPEHNPKPSYAMYAWLTQVLDRARYAGRVEHDSTSLHALDFARPDGSHVYPIWVVRGKQKVELETEGGRAEVFDAYGNSLPVAAQGGRMTVEATDAPLYVTGTRVKSVVSHTPVETPRDPGRIIFKFDSPDQLREVKDKSAALEAAVVTMPRIKGNFQSATVQEGGTTALRVAMARDDDPRKLLPRYVEYALARPIVFKDQRPFALSVRVKGNGGWGRLLCEVVDAHGNIWTSVGTGTCDLRGYPYVNFDGWHTMVLQMPGKYSTDERAAAWPGNAEWGVTPDPRKQTSEDAVKPSLAYPLTLTKIIITMRPRVLYADTEVPVRNPVILLDRIGVYDPPKGM